MNTISSAIQPANTNAVFIAPGGAILSGIECFSNSTTVPAYLKLYNSLPGTAPTASDTPVLRIMIPQNNQMSLDVDGMFFSQGLWYRVTRGIADNDNVPVAANEIIVNLFR